MTNRAFRACRMLLAALLLAGPAVVAQPTLRLSADSVVAHPGDTITVAVRVRGFQQMLTSQGTLAFDSTVVEAVGTVPGALPGMSAASFGQLGRRYLTFAWFDPAVSGQTLADSAVLFAVRFRVVGPDGSRAPLHFTDVPTVLEFTRTGFQPVVPVRAAGVVRVGIPTGVAPTIETGGFGFFPNPATDVVRLSEARALWLTESLTGRRHLLRPAPDGRLDLRGWPAGHYWLVPAEGPPTRPRPLVLVR